MKCKYSCILFFSIFISTTLLGVCREVVALRTVNAPKIDGKLDDSIWENGVWHTDFSLLSEPTKLAKIQTEFKIAYDDEYLYLAARMEEPEPGCLKIEEFRNDGAASYNDNVEEFYNDAAICGDDSLEIMIDPYGNQYEYYHFITNAVGIRYDAKRSHGGQFHDIGWNSNWKIATKIGSGDWAMEVMIPLSDLNLNQKSEGPWTFNIVRNRWSGKKKEVSSFCSIVENVHHAQNFGILYLPEVKLSKYFWKIKRPFDYHIEADKGDWVLVGKLQVKNEGSPIEKFKLLFKQVSQKEAIMLDVLMDSIPIGGEKEYTFRLPVEKQKPLVLQLDIVNVDNAKDIMCRAKKTLLNVDYKPLSLQLIKPSYRNSIYSNESINELKMIIHLTLASNVLEKSKLQIRLQSEKLTSLISEMQINKLFNIQEIVFPVGDLAPGRYVIEAQVVGEDGDVIAKTSEILKKLKQSEKEWRLNENGVLECNGEAFLPKGWLDMLPGELQFLNTKGFAYNALFAREVMANEQDAIKYLNSVWKAKGYAVMYPYSSEAMVSDKYNVTKLLTTNEIKAIKQRIKDLKEHPGLMAWIIAYEPEFNEMLPSRIKQVYAILAEEDPFHPAIIVNSSIRGIIKYLGMADILMITTPMIFLKERGVIQSIDSVSYYLDVAKKMRDGTGVSWAGLQAYDYNNNCKDLVRVPTFKELRNIFYQGVIAKVKGFFWNDYPYTYNYPEVKLGVDHLIEELTVLEEAILAKEASNKLTIDCEYKNFIYFSKRIVGDEKYLFVVNTGALSQNVKFTSTLFDGDEQVFVLCENRTLEVSPEGIFSDEFGPYDTHVYLSKDLDNDISSLSEVYDAIDATNKSRKKLGNLAFEDSGVKIITSSNFQTNLITKLNDGVLGGIAWMADKDEALPQWLEFIWPSPIKLEKIMIYSDTIQHAQAQIKQDGVWIDVGDFKCRSGAHLRAVFKEVETSEIRILITEKKPGVDTITLSEVEVYNSSTRNLY